MSLPTGPADLRDQRRLVELEATIQGGLKTFVEVGAALAEIRDQRLYRLTHEAFEDYCRDRWQMSRIHAHRLIEATEVHDALLPTGNAPTVERHARELVPVLREEGPEAVREVWTEAQQTSSHPTAAIVRETRQRLYPDRRTGPVVVVPTRPVAIRNAVRQLERDLRVVVDRFRSLASDSRFPTRYADLLSAIDTVLSATTEGDEA